MAVFGIYKSLDLARDNNELQLSLDGFKIELAKTSVLARKSRERIQTVESRNEILLDSIAVLERKLEAKESEVQEQLKNIALLTQKFQETAAAYTDLAKDTQKRSDDYMALAFENANLKAKLASAKGGKRRLPQRLRAQRENNKVTAQSQKMAAPVLQKNAAPTCLAEAISLAAGEGNEGYIVKEGECTYTKQVEISVEPDVQ